MLHSLLRALVSVSLVLALATSVSGQSFAFTYTGPDTLLVGPDCSAVLSWDPDSLLVEALTPGAVVTDTVLTIAGGFEINDTLPAGTVVLVSWYAQDDLGQDSTFQFQVVIHDGTPPFFLQAPADTIVDCDAIPPAPIPGGGVQAMDQCSDTVDLVLTVSTTTGGCAQEQVITRVWVATDAAGNTAAISQVITVQDTIAPALQGLPQDLTVSCLDVPDPPPLGSGGVTVVDNCDNDPTAIFFSSSTQNPDPTQCDHRNYTLTWSWLTLDNCGNSQELSRSVTVQDDLPPMLFCPKPDTVDTAPGTCQATVSFNPDFVSDDCLGTALVTLTDTVPIENTSGTPLPTGVVDTVMVDLPFDGLPDQYITGPADLVITLFDADAESPGETFNVFGENGAWLGQTELTQTECGDGQTTLSGLPASDLNAWGQDGLIQIVLVPMGSGAGAINAICSTSRLALNLEVTVVQAPVAPLQTQYQLDNGPLQDAGENALITGAGTYGLVFTATDCSGNTDSCATTITVRDAQVPELTCPEDRTVHTDPDVCSAEVVLPAWLAVDENCGYATVHSARLDTVDLTFVDDPDAGLVPAEIPVVLSSTPPWGAGDGTLYLHVRGDLADSGEFIQVFGEDDSFLGQSGPSSIFLECFGEVVYPITIPGSQLEEWTTDGEVHLRLEPNTDSSSYPDVINPCGPLLADQTDGSSYVWLELVYQSVEPDFVIREAMNQAVVASGTLSVPSETLPVTLGVGVYDVTYTVTDLAGHPGSCSYMVAVRDTQPPDLVCRPNLVLEANPSGLVDPILTPEDLLQSPAPDNCSLDSLTASPAVFSCADAGNVFIVTLTGFDASGNSSSCSTEVSIATEALTPTFQLDTCGGQVVLLPDTTFSQPTPGIGDFFTYAWIGDNGFSSDESAPVILNPQASDAGIYTLTLTGQTGCTATGSVQLDIGPNGVFRPNLFSNSPVCQGDTLRLTTDWLEATTYIWTHTASGSSWTTMEPALTLPATPADSGSWTLLVDLGVNCISDSSLPQELMVIPFEVAVTDTVSACLPDSVILSANGVNVDAFSWLDPHGNTYPGSNPMVSVRAGQWVVYGSNAAGCTSVDTVLVSTVPKPEITALSSSCPTCIGPGETCQLVPTIFPPDTGGMYTYQWFDPTGLLFTGDSIAELTNLTAGQAGLYSLLVERTDQLCTSFPGSVQVDLADQPEVPTIEVVSGASGDPYSLCSGDSLVLQVQSGSYTGQVRYLWNSPLGQDTTLTPALTLPAVTINQSGTYTLEVVVGDCRSLPSNEIHIVVKPIPLPPVLVSNSPVCAGDTLTVCAPEIPGAIYDWLGPGLDQVAPACLVFPNADLDLQAAFQVQLTVDGCLSGFSEPLVPEIRPIPAPPVIGDNCNARICVDQVAGCVLTASSFPSGAGFFWYDADADTLLGMSGTNPVWPLDLPGSYLDGTYSFSARIVVDGCISPSGMPHQIQINTVPDLTAEAGPNLSVCAGEPVQLCATEPMIGTGQWSQVSGNPVQIIQPDLPCTEVLGAGGGDTLVFSWALSNGACEAYSIDRDTVWIAVSEPAVAASPIRVCRAGTAELSAQPLLQGQGMWSQSAMQAASGVVIAQPASATTSVDGLQAPQTYLFTWTALNGACPDSSVVVEVLNLDDQAYAGEDRTDCGYDCLSVPLSADFPALGEGVWSSPDPEVQIEVLDEISVQACGLSQGLFPFVWTLNEGVCGDSARDTVWITFEEGPTPMPDTVLVSLGATAVIDVTLNDFLNGPVSHRLVSLPDRGTVTLLPNDMYQFVAPADLAGQTSFVYELCDVQCPKVCREATVFVDIQPSEGCVVPTIITPNGDGVNDALIIPCLEQPNSYPGHWLAIYNEWGDEVYRATPYTNSWRGTYQGKRLPTGTYFTLLDLGDGQPPVSSFLVITY